MRNNFLYKDKINSINPDEKFDDYCLTEIFCQPYDDRVLTSNVLDIDGGDSFYDYCVDFFILLDEEEYYGWFIIYNY